MDKILEVKSITIVGGADKSGKMEEVSITLKRGDIVCIVGPTGSGKSRLLEDIEWMAQGDTPTGRKILINNAILDDEARFSGDNRLVAQISQNMNFVIDMTVGEFISMHAVSRLLDIDSGIVGTVIEKANELAGEKFNFNTPITALSGGQSRALMIADTAVLSLCPIVLIDEIENAGVDRKKALELLVKKEKIVLMATHDPILALLGERRIVIKNGGINKVIETSEKERQNLYWLQEVDRKIVELRDKIRNGETLDIDMSI